MGVAMWDREGLKREAGGLGISLNMGFDTGPRCLEKPSKPPRAMGPLGDAADTDGGTVLKWDIAIGDARVVRMIGTGIGAGGICLGRGGVVDR